MAIFLNDGIRTQVAKPVEDKRMNNGVPYASVSEANSLLNSTTERYESLEVIIGTESNWSVYWYKDGTGDEDLILKEEGGGIESVTGDLVDNTDPLNPIVNTPDITLEQARQNGNAVEGDIRFNNWSGLVFENSQNPANTPYRLENEDGFFGLKSSTNTGDKLAITLDNGSNYIRIDNDGNSKGLTGTYEYDKQGDRKAFAQIADIEDALEDYIQEPTTDGTSGQVLTTDGSGGRSWTTVSGGGGAEWDNISGDQSDVNISGFTNDAGFITEVTESDVTQYESALTITESQISDLGDYLESGDNISELTNDSGFTTNTGTVESVALSAPTGFDISGSPVTTTGTLTFDYSSGYQAYTTTEANKLSGIEAGAQVNVKADWNSSSGDSQILNKPNLLQLGETPTTAYRGDRGKTAYEHSQGVGNPHQTTLQDVINENGIVGDKAVRFMSVTPDSSRVDIDNEEIKVENVTDGESTKIGVQDIEFEQGGNKLTIQPKEIDNNYTVLVQAKNHTLAGLGDIITDAADIEYDNTTSGLDAENAQDAIDELQNQIDGIIPFGGLTGDVVAGTDGVTTVEKLSEAAAVGKNQSVVVLPDGEIQGEDLFELWVYDDTGTPYTLTDLQTYYPTSAGRKQGFEVRCRLLTPPTTYRKESDNDSVWIKIEGSNVV